MSGCMHLESRMNELRPGSVLLVKAWETDTLCRDQLLIIN